MNPLSLDHELTKPFYAHQYANKYS